MLCVPETDNINMMALLWIAISVLATTSCGEGEVPVAVITSSKTSVETVELLANNVYGIQRQIGEALRLPQPMHVYWEFVDLTDSAMEFYFPQVIFDKGIIAFLDATNSPTYSQYLAYEAYVLDLLQIIIDRPIDELKGETPSPNTVFMESSYGTQGLAFAALVANYSWSHLGLMYTQTSKNIDMAVKFKDALGNSVDILDEVIVDSTDKFAGTRIEQRLTSTTKHTGAIIMLVFADAITAVQLLNAGDKSAMGGSGYAWLLSSEAMLHVGKIARMTEADEEEVTFAVLKTGAVGFLQEDEEYAAQEPLHDYITALTLIAQGYLSSLNSPSFPLTGTGLRTYFLSSPATPTLPYPVTFTSDGIRSVKFIMYNVVNFALYEVGHWSSATNELIHTGRPITWPGNCLDVPDDLYPIITLVLLYPRTDASGNDYPEGRAIFNGFNLAINEINNDLTVLTNYMIDTIALNTALVSSLATIYIRQLTNVNAVGFVGPLTSEAAKAYLDADANTTDPKPFVSYGASATSLSKYSRLVRIVQPDGLQAVAVAMVIQQYGWKRVGVVYTNDDYGIGVYNSFLTNVQTLEITIANTEDKRAISPAANDELTPQCLTDIAATLADLVKNQIRIIVYLGSWRPGIELIRQARARELVGTNYAWVGAMWLSKDILSSIPALYPNETAAVLDVLDGVISLGNVGVQGARGAQFKERYFAAYKEKCTVYSMLAYDSVYFFAEAMNTMVEHGEDFHLGKDLSDALRTTEMVGASGKIQFSEGTGDRTAYGYTVHNFQNGTLVEVMTYDPLNPNIFSNRTVPIRWYHDSDLPGDSFDPYDCPFALHMVTISMNGVMVLLAIGILMFLVTLVLSIISYMRWRQVEIEHITEPVIRTWKDTLVQITIGIEFFQLVAIAPKLKSLQVVIQSASNIFMVDAIKTTQQDKSGSWQELVAVCCLCYCWFVLVILIMMNAESWLKRVPFCTRILALMSDLYLPFIGNTMFLPFTALLVDAFICDHQAQGHAFVWRDCYMQCWTNTHYVYISMSGVAIVCFVTLAVYSRPLWQQAKTGVNVISKPFFLLFKTCVQVLLIAVGKSLEGTFPLVHGIVFSMLMMAFTIVAYRMLPFNYSRFNLWSFSSQVAVFYISLLSTVSNAGDSAHVGWFISLIAGWSVIITVTLLVQRKFMPNLLVPPRHPKTAQRKVRDIMPGQAVHVRADAQFEEVESFSMVAPSGTPEVDSDSLSSSEMSSQLPSPKNDNLDSHRSDAELKPENDTHLPPPE